MYRTLLVNVIHICILKYYINSNFQPVVAALNCDSFVYAFVTLLPIASDTGKIGQDVKFFNGEGFTRYTGFQSGKPLQNVKNS
jgi:hypothetical protein